MKQTIASLICLAVGGFTGSLISTPASAQPSPNVTVYASGLNGPRGLKFGPDGLLYVAEAGTGGTTSTAGQCAQVPEPQALDQTWAAIPHAYRRSTASVRSPLS